MYRVRINLALYYPKFTNMLINLQRLILLTLLFLVYSAYPGHSQTLPYDAAKRYTEEALKADLRFVHDNLEKKHTLYL